MKNKDRNTGKQQKQDVRWGRMENPIKKTYFNRTLLRVG